MDKVYIVMGTTGEYSDRSEWAVNAHLTEASAAEQLAALVAKAKELGVHTSTNHGMPDWDEREELAKQLGDPDARVDYTGIDWFMMPVDFAPGLDCE
jgi:hypothetical protein